MFGSGLDRLLTSVVLASVAGCAAAPARLSRQDAAAPVTPATLEEFTAAASQVLAETHVPGAGIALVRSDGVEWAGGFGFADRDQRTPVSADTHFRVGSISKTFVAMALVQFAEEGDLDLEAPVSRLIPNIPIDNPWNDTDPVRVIHLLQHTAGFDDMHYNEMYNRSDPPDLALEEVLLRNPRSRVVRWRPGTRMSYSNPGYGVAGYLLERVAGRPYEDVIADRIFQPLGMMTSSFVLRPEDEKTLAKGYDAPDGPPVPFSQIYLRPAGNLHTSPRELGEFVKLLLNWGETPDQLVVDPEYLSNMELPRTTLAAAAGLLTGYGSAISLDVRGPFPLLGHDGGIDGFLSRYAYSPSRDVGFVVLLNATYAPAALARLSDLAIRYLKVDVEPPSKPTARVAADVLRAYEGYYHDAAPRNQLFAALDWLTGGRTVKAGATGLQVVPVWGEVTPLVPVSDSLFRREADVGPSLVFTVDEGGREVMTGPGVYAGRVPRWRIEVVRIPVVVSIGLLLSVVVAGLAWIAHARWARPAGFWGLKGCLLASACALVALAAFLVPPSREWGSRTPWATLTYLGSLALPVAGVSGIVLAARASMSGAGRWLGAYAVAVSLGALVVSAFLASWGLLGLQTWNW